MQCSGALPDFIISSINLTVQKTPEHGHQARTICNNQRVHSCNQRYLDNISPETFNELHNDGFVRNMWDKFNENFPRNVSHMSGVCGYFTKIIILINYFKIKNYIYYNCKVQSKHNHPGG